MSELKPCPWCGCRKLVHIPSGWIKCTKCGARGPIDDTEWGSDQEEQADRAMEAKWNHRPQTDKAVEMLEVLRLNHRYQLEVVHGLIEDLDAVIKELKG